MAKSQTPVASPIEQRRQNLEFLAYKEKKKNGFIQFIFTLIMICLIIPIPFMIMKRLKRVKPITAEEFETRVQDTVDKAKEEAWNFLGVDPSEAKVVEPIVFSNYRDKQTCFRTLNSEIRIDKENKKRIWSSDYTTTVIAFTSKQVLVFQNSFSMIKPNEKMTSYEYNYNDIICVEVLHEKWQQWSQVDEGEIKKRGAMAQLKNKALNSIGMAEFERENVEFDSFRILTAAGNESFRAYFTNTPDVRASIHGMKNLIRERKGK